MVEINIPNTVRDVLKTLDLEQLATLIAQIVSDGRPGATHILGLEGCGPYVTSCRRIFEQALTEHSKAKSSATRQRTESNVRSTADKLMDSIRQMISRLEIEEKESSFFYIEDRILPPSRFSENLIVRINFQWRSEENNDWRFGSICYRYTANFDSGLESCQVVGKLSAARKEQDRQGLLCREWEHLAQLALSSLREYFRKGGDGARIPSSFQVLNERYDRGLNNFSADFWRERT